MKTSINELEMQSSYICNKPELLNYEVDIIRNATSWNNMSTSCDGVYYYKETNTALILVLHSLLRLKQPVKLIYGDKVTGEIDVCDVAPTLGKLVLMTDREYYFNTCGNSNIRGGEQTKHFMALEVKCPSTMKVSKTIVNIDRILGIDVQSGAALTHKSLARVNKNLTIWEDPNSRAGIQRYVLLQTVNRGTSQIVRYYTTSKAEIEAVYNYSVNRGFSAQTRAASYIMEYIYRNHNAWKYEEKNIDIRCISSRDNIAMLKKEKTRIYPLT